MTNQAPILAQPVPCSSFMFLLLYDFQNRNQHRGLSTSSRAAVADEANTVRLHSTDDVSVTLKQLHTVHCNSWTTATTSTSSPDLCRLRSRPEGQLIVLPVYDPGDFRLKEDEGRISFYFNGYLGYFGRILERNRRRIVMSSRRFSEKRRIGNSRKGIENQRKPKKIWGLFSRDFGFVLSRKKKIWEFLSNGRFSFVMEEVLCVFLVEKVKDLGFVLMEVCREKEDLCCFAGRRNEEDKLLGLLSERREDFKGCTPNPISKRYRFEALRFGLVGPLGELGHHKNWAYWATIELVTISVLGKMGHLQIMAINSVGLFSNWDNSRLGPLGPLLQLVFHFKFLDQLGHCFKLPSLRTRMFSRKRECKDCEIRDLIIWGFWQIRDFNCKNWGFFRIRLVMKWSVSNMDSLKGWLGRKQHWAYWATIAKYLYFKPFLFLV